MRNQKMWVLAIGLQIAKTMVLGGCQLSLGVACGDGLCAEREVCLDSGSASPVCIRSICGNGHLEPGEECDDGNTSDGDGCSSKCTREIPPARPLPQTCADAAAAVSTPPDDNEYTLYFGRDSNKPWKAYCHDMASGASKEYLSLIGTEANFSQYTAGFGTSGTNVRTSYAKVRIDPFTLLVDTQDGTFATSTGSLTQGSVVVTSVRYAYAASCDAQPSGVANVNLQGTPFTISRDAFTFIGFDPVGIVMFSANDQIADLTGGGFCGIHATPSGELELIYP